MATEYADLSGGSGHTARYRAPRLKARELPGGPTRIESGGLPVLLNDLSLTGASFYTQDAPSPGESVSISLWVGDAAAFQARSEVVRHESASDRTKVAVRFLDRLFDFDDLRRVSQRQHFEHAVREGLDAYRLVPARYRAICAQAALFLNHWRAMLDQHEAALEPDAADSALHDVTSDALEAMRPEWQAIRQEASQITNEIADDDPAFEPSRRYTQLQLSPLLRPSPFLWRCFDKPLGYPGDYVAMGWMYDRPTLAPTVFGRALDQLGFEERLAATVPDRKELLVRYLRETVAAASPGRPVRILNIGSGPAREVVEFLQQSTSLPPLRVVLVDQDEDALARAHEALRRAALRHGDSVQVHCHFLSFKQLFANRELISGLVDQDLVYSAGLFDYLPEAIGSDLLRNCAKLLRPDGLLAVGNAAAAPDVRWVPEFVLDWHMIYRTEAEMERLAATIDVPVEARFERDPSAAWHFLALRRRSQRQARGACARP